MVTCSVGFCRCPRFISCYIHARIPLVLVNYIKKKIRRIFQERFWDNFKKEAALLTKRKSRL